MSTTTSPVVDAPNERAGFQRIEGYDLEIGRYVGYQLPMTGLMIVAHRFGVALRGSTPVISREGAKSFYGVIERAVVHHEHLRDTYVAGQQSYLTEDEVTLKMPVGAIPVAPRTHFGSDAAGNPIFDNT